MNATNITFVSLALAIASTTTSAQNRSEAPLGIAAHIPVTLALPNIQLSSFPKILNNAI